MADLEIRAADAPDADALVELCRQLGYPVSADDVRAHLAASDQARPGVFVGLRAGRVVGWVELTTRRALESGSWAEITGLVVDEGTRSQGVGGQLVAFARIWARDRGLTRLRVRTNLVRERTARFYERQGFVLAKQQRVFDLPL
jgi:GNAT superfamily N-acetyltransferase